ncbi:LacI family transcriptional regulator [Litorimonas cladophorae]|uniref:LacI family transcriptional regulator n=1 Tax=Litorimonas cladophorae TaxID=1220491 RepID=A0A918KI10_9PROT|nr:LacI family DNA-binding transcriptional regulator [Litorimonas cladophorae]GGX61879.1 LacI family transcriptional regulator [Litorimonas cladophorae]
MTTQRDKGTITINDIARMSGVSKKTVSRVINKSPSVGANTRKQIEKIIEETGFIPNPQAQALAFRRSFLIALVYDNPSPQYIANIQRGVLKALEGTRFQLVLRPCDRAELNYHDKILSFVQQHNPFGLIFVPSMSEDIELSRKLKERNCHFVRIASVDLTDPAHQIKTADAEGAKLAARHLAQLGHTKVAHIHGPELFQSTHERRDGFKAGLAEFGLSLAPELTIEGAYTFDSGVKCATTLLHGKERPTAIFTGNDEMAVGVYVAARKAGLRIPQDLSVVGFDDTPIVSRIWPPMTSVRFPIRDLGFDVATLLIDSDKMPPAQQRTVPQIVELDLIIRESTTAPVSEIR